MSLIRDLFGNVSLELGDRDSYLLHSVAVADGYAAITLFLCVANGIKVNGDAKRCADLVLTAVSLTDRTGLVIVEHKLLGEICIDLACLVGELLRERKDSCLEGCKCRMEVHNGSYIVLSLVDNFLIVSIAKYCQNASFYAERRLNNVGDVSLIGLGIEVGEILSRLVLMLGKVVVGSVSNAPKLAPSEREEELEVGGCLGIEAKLLGIVVAETDVLVTKTDGKQPIVAEFSPICEPLEVGAGLAEELKLHLLELTYTEDEVTGSDLVTEGLTDLRDTEGHLASGGSLYVYKVGENTLCGLGTEINCVLCVLGYALKGLEHKVELTDVGEVMLTACGARNVVLFNEFLHFSVGESIDGLGKLKAVLCAPVLDELVSAESFVALTAVHKGIREACKVTRSYPSLRVHENCGVETDVVLVLLNELLPPSLLYVVLKLNSERTVVPSVSKAAVDFGAGENEAAVLTKSHDLVHGFCVVVHFYILFFNYKFF